MTRDRTRPLVLYILAFGLSLTVPLLVYAAVVTIQFASSERLHIEAQARDLDDSLTSAVEREITGQIATLQALATSSSLRDGDFEHFHRRATEFTRLQGAHLIVRDRAGRRLVDTRLPWGSPLPRGASEPDRTISETRASDASDLFVCAVTGRLMVAVTVPVIHQGEAAYLLSANIPVERLHGRIQMDGIAPPYIASVADRNGIVLARSGANAEFVGKPLPGFADARGASGAWSGVNPQGVPVVAVYRRSSLTGWLIAVEVSQEAVEAPLRRSLWQLGGLGALLLTIAGALAYAVVGEMTRTCRALAGMAQDLGAGRAGPAPPLRIREARPIATALAEAARGLRERDAVLARSHRELERRVAERTRELAESEARYRLLADYATDMVVQADMDTTRRYVSPAVKELLGYEPHELIGTRPLDAVHPDDVAGYRRVFDGLEQGRIDQAIAEQRYRRKDGSYVWVEAKFRLIRDAAGGPSGYVASIRDISERRAAQDALRASETRFRLLAEGVPDRIAAA